MNSIAKYHGITVVERMVMVCLFGFLVCRGAVAVFLSQEIQNPAEAVLRINGVAISSGELLFYMERSRAETVSYFQRTYGLEFGENFWQTEVGGSTPADALRERAVEALIPAKVIQIQAQRRALVHEISFDNWVMEFEVGDKEPSAYGIANFDFRQYYDYRQSKISLELEKALIGTEFGASEDDIRAFYEKEKESYRDSEDDEPPHYLSYESVRYAVMAQYYHYRYVVAVKSWVAQAKVEYVHPDYEKVWFK